jgi:hypothetical protein
MTTNEEHGKVHPAVMRKGRTFADIQFEMFSPLEAQKWLNSHGIDGSAAKTNTTEPTFLAQPTFSLADLYQIKAKAGK